VKINGTSAKAKSAILIISQSKSMNKQAFSTFALAYTKKLRFFAFALGLYYLCRVSVYLIRYV
jgi:hypothetical protein